MIVRTENPGISLHYASRLISMVQWANQVPDAPPVQKTDIDAKAANKNGLKGVLTYVGTQKSPIALFPLSNSQQGSMKKLLQA